MISSEQKIERVDKAYSDYLDFMSQGKYEYAAIAVRTITEVIVYSYAEFYVPVELEQENSVTIMDLLKALSLCPSFRQDQMTPLHTMRKIGNAGAHQGEDVSFELSEMHMNNTSGTVSTVINVWKTWLDEDYDKWYSAQENARRESYENKKKKDSQTDKKYAAIAIIAIGVIVFITIPVHLGFFTEGLTFYRNHHIRSLYLGYALFIVVTLFCCRRGPISKAVCTVGMLYFLIPRIYLAFLCRNTHVSDFIMFVLVCFGIVIIYAIACIRAKESTEGYELKGYKDS